MSLTSRIRVAAFRRLPKHWQPPAAYHYYRARSLIDPELDITRRVLRPGLRAVDVGANEGVYTHAFRGTGAFVDAFEPNPEYVATLSAYARHHRTVRVHDVALGARAEEATLSVPVRDGRAVAGHGRLAAVDGAATRFPVSVRTLDSFRLADVAVIKIDVEGHELEVLRGARETVGRCRPLLLLEIEQRHLGGDIAEVFGEITELGYDGSFLLPNAGARPLAEFDAAMHQRSANADRPHALYVNNFIFRPTSGALSGYALA